MVSFFLFMLTDEDGTTTTTRNVGKYREIVLDAAHTVASALVADNWTPKTPRTGGGFETLPEPSSENRIFWEWCWWERSSKQTAKEKNDAL